MDPNIIVPSDASSFQRVEDAGQEDRRMFDRRVNGWIQAKAYLFDAIFDDGAGIEVQVNPEFGSRAAAQEEALKYLHAIGQLPSVLRKDVQTVWLHKGTEPFGGGNNNLLIHSGQATEYIRNGILEETFVHEAAHTSLDAEHAQAAGWIEAQQRDGDFISKYAADNPVREDVAESYLPYFAIRYRPERISQSLKTTIRQTIPARIQYFDQQNFAMHPVSKPAPLAIHPPQYDKAAGVLRLRWNSKPDAVYMLESSDDLANPLSWRTITQVLSGGLETATELTEKQLSSPQWFRVREQ